MNEGMPDESQTTDPEPDRDKTYYAWLKWWYRQPENQEKARELERWNIEVIQSDKNLD